MDKLRAMQIFVQIVESGSLTAAADSMRMSPPTVVRSLAALERATGVRLLNRTTRRLSLTDEGREYYERCKRVLGEIDEAEAALSARRALPRGRLRITASVMYGRLRVAPIVAEFLQRHPGVEIELLLLDRVVDLVEEGIDLGVRIAQLPESSVVAVAVGETRRITCASPAYLKRAGVPKVPRDLAQHRCIAFSGLSSGGEWMLGHGRGERVRVRPVLTTNQVDAAVDACVRGLGCGQFLSYQVQGLLAAGALRRLLPDHEPPALPIHVVYPHGRLLSPNVRAFVDFAVPKLRAT
jgi:DNA-binding transcriptional LysR family regulator